MIIVIFKDYHQFKIVFTLDTRRVYRVGSVGYEWLGTVGTSGTSTPAGGWRGRVPTSTQVICWQPDFMSLYSRPENGLHWAVVQRKDGERASQQGGGRGAAGWRSQVRVMGSIEPNSLSG